MPKSKGCCLSLYPMVVIKLVVNVSSENRRSKQLFPTPGNKKRGLTLDREKVVAIHNSTKLYWSREKLQNKTHWQGWEPIGVSKQQHRNELHRILTLMSSFLSNVRQILMVIPSWKSPLLAMKCLCRDLSFIKATFQKIKPVLLFFKKNEGHLIKYYKLWISLGYTDMPIHISTKVTAQLACIWRKLWTLARSSIKMRRWRRQ